jgi:hypothetical protein
MPRQVQLLGKIVATTRMDPRNYMHDACESHIWFIFNLHTKISLYLQIICCNIYKIYNISTQPDPLHFNGHPLYLLEEPASLLLVTNTHPPLSLVCQQLSHPLLCPSHAFTPHSSNYMFRTRRSRSRNIVLVHCRVNLGWWEFGIGWGWGGDEKGEVRLRAT